MTSGIFKDARSCAERSVKRKRNDFHVPENRNQTFGNTFGAAQEPLCLPPLQLGDCVTTAVPPYYTMDCQGSRALVHNIEPLSAGSRMPSLRRYSVTSACLAAWGGIGGTIVGAFILGVLSSGLNRVGVPSYYQQVIKGAVFILTVMLDLFTKRRR